MCIYNIYTYMCVYTIYTHTHTHNIYCERQYCFPLQLHHFIYPQQQYTMVLISPHAQQYS